MDQTLLEKLAVVDVVNRRAVRPDAGRRARARTVRHPVGPPAGPARTRGGTRCALLALCAVALAGAPAHAAGAAELPIFDAHVHYSHDAWDVVPTADVIALMRKAGLKRALVSSSDDEGTQKLYAAAPELIVPSLRPYRRRGEISTWIRDDSVVAHVEDRLRRHRYAAIGEFHLYGADADLPVPRRLVQLAREHGLILHAHSDVEAIERILRQDPEALVLWAHSGFEPPATVREMLRKHPRLYADLAFRSEMGSPGSVDPDWLAAFREFPDRFMVGTDTFTPERLHYIPEHASYTRGWLAAVPPALAERIAWKNAESLIGPVWAASRAKGRETAGAGAGAGAQAHSPADCEAIARTARDAQRLESDRLLIVYRVGGAPIRVGEPFSLEVAACPKAARSRVESLAVDAQMPEHRHAMNYAPKIASAGSGRYSADGLVLHMPGHWRLVFDVRIDGRGERLVHDLNLR